MHVLIHSLIARTRLVQPQFLNLEARSSVQAAIRVHVPKMGETVFLSEWSTSFRIALALWGS